MMTLTAASILLTPMAVAEQQAHPFFRTEHYPAWSQMTPQQAIVDIRAAIQQTRERLTALAAITPETSTFENTFLAWFEADENINQVATYVSHLRMALGTKEIQHATNEITREISQFKAEGLHSARIINVLRQAAEAPWMPQLSPAKQRFVLQTLQRLRNSGVFLSPEQQARRATIQMQLSKLGYRFSFCVRNSPNAWELIITDPAELEGMPEAWMKRAAQLGKEKTGSDKPCWLINLSTSHASRVLSYCKVAETRRKCWVGITSAGTAHAIDTEPYIHEILKLRHELATLLGYANYADMQAANRMMGNGQRALDYINKMLEQSKPLWDAYVAGELKRYSQACGKELTAVAPWDVRYLNRHLPPQRAVNFNLNEITPYLQADTVVKGLIKLWSNMLSLKIEELPAVCLKQGETPQPGQVETWHPDVRCFAVRDAATGRHLGSFYMDIYARQGKRPLAWCLPMRSGNPGEPHLGVLMANLTPPRQGKPHVFTHDEIHMLFHEFGHIMHMLLGHGELRAHATANIERDFIEMPSHLQETWIWEPEALATFTAHHATGAPLPEHLAQKVAASRGGNPIEHHMYMLCMAKLDLELHMHYHDRYQGRPIDEVSEEILKPWLFPYTQQPPSEVRTMTYTMAESYAASFYTYKWCEMLAADAFSRFKKEGVLNPAVGAEYRRCILDKGGTVPAMQQIRDFLGREPKPDALIERYQQLHQASQANKQQ